MANAIKTRTKAIAILRVNLNVMPVMSFVHDTMSDKPMAPPIWCITLTKPDAAPVSLLLTPSIPRFVSGLIASPCPKPIRIIGKHIDCKYELSFSVSASHANPAKSINSPTRRMGMLPCRQTSFGTANAPQNVVMVMGRNEQPVSNGEKPNLSCKNTDMAKL